MHSPINAVNELPLLTYDANYCVTKNIQTVPSCAEPRGWGLAPGAEGSRTLLGGTVELHRMGHYAWDSSRGGVRVCAHTGLLVGCACVRARDSVC